MQDCFDEICTALSDLHNIIWTDKHRIIFDEMLMTEKSLRLAILLEKLSSIILRSSICAVARKRLAVFTPICRKIFCTFLKLEDEADAVRFSFSKLLASFLLLNSEVAAEAKSCLDAQKISIKLDVCRRILLFSSDRRRPNDSICEKCSVISSASDASKDNFYACAAEKFTAVFSTALSEFFQEKRANGTNTLVEILATWNLAFSDENLLHRLREEFLVNWSRYGPFFCQILTSDNRQVLRNALEILYVVFSSCLQDVILRKIDSKSPAAIAGDFLQFLTPSKIFSAISILHSTDNYWFGGRIKNEKRDDSNIFYDHSLARFSMVVPALAMALQVSNKAENFVADSNTQNYIDRWSAEDQHIMVSILLDQDDHFCDFFLSALIIERQIKILSPHTLWLSLLEHTGWDYEVILDWLTSSETTFLTAFLRYLKYVLVDPDQLLAEASTFSSKGVQEHMASEQPSQSASSSSGFEETLAVEEIIGKKKKRRMIQMRPLIFRSPTDNISWTTCQKNVTSEVFTVFLKLYTVLANLSEKGLVAFNVQPLLNLLRRINRIEQKIYDHTQ